MKKLALSAEGAEFRAIRAEFRENDESDLWPICGRFNATERAIRNLRPHVAQGMTADEYRSALDAEISRIVNGAV